MYLRSILSILFFGFSFLRSYTQQAPNHYMDKWKKIDSLISQKGQTQSALKEVNLIYAQAKKSNNDGQLIKALLYKMGLQESTQEDAGKKNIFELQKELATSNEPAKSILTSILAEAYWNYFQQNRYGLYGRSNTVNFKKEDIATWGLADFHQKISTLYLSSLKNKKLLQETKLEPFDAIIVKGNVRYLRPSLYDLLAHRALEYFKNDERDINKPAYAFELDDKEVFADGKTFANYHFPSEDSSSLHLKALQLFQELILFHEKDTRPDALIDVDIERLEFAKQYAVMEDKEGRYFKALEAITDKYKDYPAAAQAWYLQAQVFAGKAALYDPLKDSSNRYAYLKAKEICEKIIAQKDSSEGKVNCQNLLHEIQHKDLGMEIEKVNVPYQPFRALISYRNFTKLYFRIIKVNRKLKEALGNQWQDDYWKQLVKISPLKTFYQDLPETNDFQKHRVEIKIDSLPPGEYALFSSVDEHFSEQKNPMAIAYFYVSNIAFINNNLDYFVLNRETGQPLPRVNVQAWYQYYDSRQLKWLERKGENFITDKNGSFSISKPKTDNNNSLRLEFTSMNDHLFLDDQMQLYNYRTEEGDNNIDKASYEKNNLKTFFFTDRAIYRPGQTVYFKGIVVTKDFETKQSKVLTAFKTMVILQDANEEEIDSVWVTTNEFGSYHGQFKLPENGLNGEFRISDDSTGNEQSFSVEEYKRPKFFVEYEKQKGTYHINDSIKVTGSAKAYAGNAIDGAMVKYRVVRQPRFLYPWRYGRWGMPRASSQEIAHGEIKTDAEGKFTIQFVAIPDKSVKKEFDPVFDYQVTTDITDINGETRTGETTVPVGYKALNLSISLPLGNPLLADSLKNIFIKTENLSGEFEPSKVDVVIYKLKSPDRLIRERFWEQPDQFVMDKETYLQNFPYDEYSDETKKESWEKIARVFENTDTTHSNGVFELTRPSAHDQRPTANDHRSSFSPGWYLIEASAKDKYGQEVKDIQYMQLQDAKTETPASPSYNWTVDNYQISEPGKVAKASIGSSAKDLFIITQLDRTQNAQRETQNAEQPTTNYTFLNLSNEKKSIPYNISESDRGGFGVFFAFVKNNRFYNSGTTISVPWTNKELSISYETYRDKTLPGAGEKWKIKISGYKKDKVAAEVLASMYDASLDQFKEQSWSTPNLYHYYYRQTNWNNELGFSSIQAMSKFLDEYGDNYFTKTYDLILNPNETRQLSIRGMASPSASGALMGKAAGVQISQGNSREMDNVVVTAFGVSKKKDITSSISRLIKNEDDNGETGESGKSNKSGVQIRKNFNETAFFFPDLKTDSLGNVEFSFTMPEALTQWKWMTLAHTKDLAFGYAEKSIITQKELMVQPNMPRFLREGDHISLSTKIVNLTDSEFTGQVELQLLDATTNQSVDGWFQNIQPNQYFTVGAKQSEAVVFDLHIPYQFNKPLTYRIIARSGAMSDGEENSLPVLSNRMLVTESIPLAMNGLGKKDFKFQKLIQSGNSETLNNHSLTLEYSSNPAWYAVQALPYLMEYPYECAEQTFNRFYANALATRIVNVSPRIKEIFEKWKTADTAALLSNLQKNQELKSVLLEETPWVLQGKDESQQKRNIALLFDMAKMSSQLESAIDKLQDMQLDNGGFAWFKGGVDNRYITQYILTGIGHLKKLNAVPSSTSDKINIIVNKAIAYLDKKIKDDYDYLLKHKSNLKLNNLGYTQIQYLYMRSFFSDHALPGNCFDAMNYYRKQSQQFWLQQNKYMQGMIALSLFRTGDVQKAKDILESLKQNAIMNEELGMYWKENSGGYYWQQAPIETQSLLIEAFSEIGKDDKLVGNLKIWLLKQKQTQNWGTTKATAEACYALLMQGKDWLGQDDKVDIQLGSTVISSNDQKTETGTGYFKKVIEGSFVKPDMGNISVSVSSPSPKGGGRERASWGAVYWQYFEDLDKITPAATPLKLSKKLFVERNTDRGPVLEPVLDNGNLKVGDKIKVRIELRVDRDMEYVHMKDMRASCMEPVNVLSGYKWQGGLGYYESTKDASTNFFFDWLPKGTYVFEYPLFVMSAGNFSNGVTTIQCMYAPGFTSHSDGVRVNVE
ncbi:MAG: alpha-2-macroglobulin [Bacteroidetes bacterium]|nr:alpha-2-macroglobulin [Bacteroidota bacterium]